MKEYILSIAGVAILSAVISMLLPEKKMKKTIEGILKLCMVSTLILPIADFFRENSQIFFDKSSISAEDVAYINNSYALAIENHILDTYSLQSKAEYDRENNNLTLTVYGGEQTVTEKIKSDVCFLIPDVKVVIKNEPA